RTLAALVRRAQVRNRTTNRLRDELVRQLERDLPVLDLLPDEGPLGFGQGLVVDQAPDREGNAVTALAIATICRHVSFSCATTGSGVAWRASPPHLLNTHLLLQLGLRARLRHKALSMLSEFLFGSRSVGEIEAFDVEIIALRRTNELDKVSSGVLLEAQPLP